MKNSIEFIVYSTPFRSSLVGIPGLQKEKLSVYNFLTNTPTFDEAAAPLPALTAPPSSFESSKSREESSSLPQVKEGRKKKSRWDIKPAILSIIEERRKNVTEEDKVNPDGKDDDGIEVNQ